MIKNHITTSLSIGVDDFEYAPFYEKGGRVKPNELFVDKLTNIMEELNEVLVG